MAEIARSGSSGILDGRVSLCRDNRKKKRYTGRPKTNKKRMHREGR